MRLLTLLFFFAQTSLFAQTSFGLKVAGGGSVLPIKYLQPNSTFRNDNYFRGAGMGGMYLDHKIGQYMVFSSELKYASFGSTQELHMSIDWNGADYTEVFYQRDRRLHYFGSNVAFGLNLKRFTMKVGLGLDIELSSRINTTGEYVVMADDPTFPWNGSHPVDYTDGMRNERKWNGNVTLEVSYRVTERFSVHAMVYEGMKQEENYHFDSYTWRISAFAFGASFKLFEFPRHSSFDKHGITPHQ